MVRKCGELLNEIVLYSFTLTDRVRERPVNLIHLADQPFYLTNLSYFSMFDLA